MSIENTLNLLQSLKDSISWEWEDEQFWSRNYKQLPRTLTIGKDRLWQREQLITQLTSQLNLKGKVILDIGCGKSQEFRLLFSKYCDKNTLYIGTDISFGRLKASKLLNNHDNSLYVLCSADYLLPF